jgi:hypothetical protein
MSARVFSHRRTPGLVTEGGEPGALAGRAAKRRAESRTSLGPRRRWLGGCCAFRGPPGLSPEGLLPGRRATTVTTSSAGLMRAETSTRRAASPPPSDPRRPRRETVLRGDRAPASDLARRRPTRNVDLRARWGGAWHPRGRFRIFHRLGSDPSADDGPGRHGSLASRSHARRCCKFVSRYRVLEVEQRLAGSSLWVIPVAKAHERIVAHSAGDR